jgi:hypothetical protein
MALTIRQAGTEDLPATVRLFEVRDRRSYKPEQIRHLFGDFTSDQSLAWLAYDGCEPVGMTMMLIRELKVDEQKVRAGYWANLYVAPRYRCYLLYPRLTHKITEALRKYDLSVVYTGVRHPEVARAHAGVGFVRLGELKVRAKPLRPARLLLRYKGWSGCEPIAALPDFLYRKTRGLAKREQTKLNGYALGAGVDFAEFASLLNQSQFRVCQVWSTGRLRERYAANLDGEPYKTLGARREGTLVAAMLWRVAVRGNGVRAGVIMDLVFQQGEEGAAWEVLAAAEAQAQSEGCDVMLHLDGVSESSRIIDAAGYWSSPERYNILAWPPQATKRVVPTNLRGWRYAFGDHDAF